MSQRTSCISHPAGTWIILIRESYVGICSGSPNSNCCAALLQYFAHWADTKLANLPQAQAENAVRRAHNNQLNAAEQDQKYCADVPESLWVWASIKDIRQAMNNEWKDDKVRACLQWLQDQRFLLRRQHPTLRWKRTPQYVINIPVVQQSINVWALAQRVSNVDETAPEFVGDTIEEIGNRLSDYLDSTLEKSGLEDQKNRESVVRLLVSLFGQVQIDRRTNAKGGTSAHEPKDKIDSDNPLYKPTSQMLGVYTDRQAKKIPGAKINKARFREKHYNDFLQLVESGLTVGDLARYLDAMVLEPYYRDNPAAFPAVDRVMRELSSWVNQQRFADNPQQNPQQNPFQKMAKQNQGENNDEAD